MYLTLLWFYVLFFLYAFTLGILSYTAQASVNIHDIDGAPFCFLFLHSYGINVWTLQNT